MQVTWLRSSRWLAAVVAGVLDCSRLPRPAGAARRSFRSWHRARRNVDFNSAWRSPQRSRPCSAHWSAAGSPTLAHRQRIGAQAGPAALALPTHCAPGGLCAARYGIAWRPYTPLLDFLNGVAAKGYPYAGDGRVDLAVEPLRGYVRLREDGVIEYEAIDDRPLSGGDFVPGKAPTSLALSTPVGGAMLVDVHPQTGGAFNFGGNQESVVRVRASSVLFGLDLPEIRGLKLHDMSVRFDGLGSWAGIRTLDTSRGLGSGGVPNGATISLKSHPTLVASKKLPSLSDADPRR